MKPTQRLRIVTDAYLGFEVQIELKIMGIFTIWKQPRTNTHRTVEAAREWAKNYLAHEARRKQAVRVIEYILVDDNT